MEQAGPSAFGRRSAATQSSGDNGRGASLHARMPLPPSALEESVLQHLLVRPKRLDHEHGQGHWLRTAHENGLRDPAWLHQANSPPGQVILRVCPLCLAQPQPVWHEAWLDRAMPVCALHQVWLVDQCQACQKPLRWGRVRFQACRCGRDLRELRAEALAPDLRKALVLEGVPLHVLLWLGALERYGLMDKPLKKASRQKLSDVIGLAQTGATVAHDWPAALFQTFDRRRVDSRTAGSLSLLNDALPGMTKLIGKIRDAVWRTKIAGALQAYALETGHTPAPLIGRNVPGSNPPTLLSLARGVGTRPERLAAAVDQLLESEVKQRHTAGGRCRRAVLPAAAAAARRALDEELRLKPAARLLRFTLKRLRQLIQEGRLVARRGRVRRSAVEELNRCLTDKVVAERPRADTIPLDLVLRYWIPIDRTSQFLDAIQAGELTVYCSGRPHRSDQPWFGAAQLRQWLSMAPPENRAWVTIPEAARQLGLKQEVAYHLVHVGLIATKTIRADRRVARVIEGAALREFEEGCEPLARAAARAGVDRRCGLEWAKRNGLQLVSGPQIDGGRQYFVRRAGL